MRYGGSNKANSVERDSLRKEQLLEPLAPLELRLHPEVGVPRGRIRTCSFTA